jgi:hypothetical protein
MTRARDVANIDGILTTKGDIYAATAAATPARLGVGSNGETLVADSSTSTGLSYQANWAAGKNKFINGDFRINQRNFTSSTDINLYFTFDRWANNSSGGTTASAQTFTPGTAPVAGYEGTNFFRQVITGQVDASGDYTQFIQPVEDVRTFAGQQVTVSFWAKAASGTPKIALELQQNFGTGGSPSATVLTYAGQYNLTTSWTRHSLTFTVPSISGKTLGTNANSQSRFTFWTSAATAFNARTGSLGIQSNTFDIWGVQVEAGSVATAFQTATGTIQGELAACQRYYVRTTPGTAFGYLSNTGSAVSTTASMNAINVATMRTVPTSLDFANIALTADDLNVIAITSAIINSNASANQVIIKFTVASGLTQYRPYWVLANNNVGAFVGLSAEL